MKYLIDFIVLALLYVFYLFKKWKRKGKDVLIFNKSNDYLKKSPVYGHFRKTAA